MYIFICNNNDTGSWYLCYDISVAFKLLITISLASSSNLCWMKRLVERHRYGNNMENDLI